MNPRGVPVPRGYARGNRHPYFTPRYQRRAVAVPAEWAANHVKKKGDLDE
jgi:hypothetical protein